MELGGAAAAGVGVGIGVTAGGAGVGAGVDAGESDRGTVGRDAGGATIVRIAYVSTDMEIGSRGVGLGCGVAFGGGALVGVGSAVVTADKSGVLTGTSHQAARDAGALGVGVGRTLAGADVEACTVTGRDRVGGGLGALGFVTAPLCATFASRGADVVVADAAGAVADCCAEVVGSPGDAATAASVGGFM